MGTAQPASKADCKKGGWRDFGFRNQGQCIRHVNHLRSAPSPIPTTWDRSTSFETDLTSEQDNTTNWPNCQSPFVVTRVQDAPAGAGSWSANIDTGGSNFDTGFCRITYNLPTTYGEGDSVWLRGSPTRTGTGT
jgi:hypothetical protein